MTYDMLSDKRLQETPPLYLCTIDLSIQQSLFHNIKL